MLAGLFLESFLTFCSTGRGRLCKMVKGLPLDLFPSRVRSIYSEKPDDDLKVLRSPIKDAAPSDNDQHLRETRAIKSEAFDLEAAITMDLVPSQKQSLSVMLHGSWFKLYLLCSHLFVWIDSQKIHFTVNVHIGPLKFLLSNSEFNHIGPIV